MTGRPAPLTDEQMRAVLAEMYAGGGTDVRWYYLSFVGDGRFLGGVYLEAWHPTDALMRSHVLGLNPGGEVETWELDTEEVEANLPIDKRYRLLTKEEVNA